MSEVDVRAFADEDCPVCDGAGYTDGVTVRHPCYNCNPAFELDRATDRLVEVGAVELEHAALPLDALGHQDDILAAFAAYDRLVRWEETREGSRLDATETIIERAQARGHIVALVANIAVAALQERLEAAERERDYLRSVVEQTHRDMDDALGATAARVAALDSNGASAHRAAGDWKARAEAAERLNGELAGALERLLAFVGYACDYRDGTNTDPATCPGDPPYAEGPCATCEAGLALTRIKSASADNCPGHGLTQVWCDWCGDLPRTTDVERGSLNHGR